MNADDSNSAVSNEKALRRTDCQYNMKRRLCVFYCPSMASHFSIAVPDNERRMAAITSKYYNYSKVYLRCRLSMVAISIRSSRPHSEL